MIEKAINKIKNKYSWPLIYANKANKIKISDESFIFNCIFETLHLVKKIKNIMPMQNIDIIILYILPFIFIFQIKKRSNRNVVICILSCIRF